ncbi:MULTISPECIES: SDR family NAD(P)-dependent oxidoreductase [Geobacillus]|jgi:3-oxoacyl-[acyl-carrier protein] reductase|uniref:Oxidoreductase, short chain dehydrogenase/reductase family n=3 Tax=Geobacillus thermodenitrificans TaxID=33940 RepID=A4IK22_GEOTN|nr:MULTISPECIES: SDR family oxidoreductase [Geobacillus]ABO65676.1 Oxidoreductase, short chain dehydrogenase/reductase family [Geobacillus thermodenitrificans NG80-2]ARA97883.1 3-ketoacyl-ACP reductase [Geobacillus thermodenitrificans]MED0664404.1 NAD(P)-dependent oxidoreductase [Geobacillus thermodenitrificans]MED3716153.1 SDR family oxidoreductase [Geobacillus thermodenitrificans]MED4918801.1 SDR family oxidoreductase [Geobacillus thermodenitrificans]
MRFLDKVVIVTGAAGGMGKAAVKRFLDEGAHVVALDLYPKGIPETADHFYPLAVDVTNEEKVKQVFQEIRNQFGKIDALVNFVGIAQQAEPIEQVSLNKWMKILNTNVTSLFLLCKEAVQIMKDTRNKGAIVNVASISVVRPRPGLQSYIASKGAVVSFSQALALELAPYQIRVNVIHPGPCDTDMLGEFAALGSDVNVVKEEIFKKSIPLGELIQPEDVASTALYLCSDEAHMITGSVIHVDGGRGI